MPDAPEQARRAQPRDHIAELESAVESVEVAAAARPAGADREQMTGLAQRLRRRVDELHGELEVLGRARAGGAALCDAAARD